MYESLLKVFETEAKKAIEALKYEFNHIRAGRANPALLDRITIDYHGVATPLNQVASISVPEARLLVIQPWDKSIIPAIEQAIQKSDLGITPSNDGDVIRLPFPPLTEERRKDLTKQAKQEAENSKVRLRNIRRDSIDEIKRLEKEESMREDDVKSAENEVQKLVEKYNDKVDDVLAEKEKELMEF